MSINANFVRDTNELEGALLPVAQLVDPTTSTEEWPTAPMEAHVTTAHVSSREVPLAPVIPDGIFDPSQLDYVNLRQGEHVGRNAAQQEVEEIHRANRRVYAIDYNTQREIKDGNLFARQKNQAETAGALYTDLSTPFRGVKTTTSVPNTSPPSTTRPPIHGTFGKDYTVSEYNVGSYDTREYDISEYKSVYEG